MMKNMSILKNLIQMYSVENDAQEFIVVTESGILVEMQRLAPQKTFIPAPPNDSDSPCNECEYMKYITLRSCIIA